MNEYTTTKALNPEQLAYELGKGLRVVGPEPDGTYTVKVAPQDATLAQLQAAVETHVAQENWTDPKPPPPKPEPEPPLTPDEVRALRALLKPKV